MARRVFAGLSRLARTKNLRGPRESAPAAEASELWWDDDNDNVTDGTPASTLNFNTGTSLANSGSHIW